DTGHLQAIQSQEVVGPLPEPVPALARLAVLAGRPGSRQPGHPDSAESRVSGPETIVPQSSVLLVLASRDLPDHRQGGFRRRPADLPEQDPSQAPPRSPPCPDSPPDRRAGPAGPVPPRSLAIPSGPEGLEHPHQDRFPRPGRSIM